MTGGRVVDVGIKGTGCSQPAITIDGKALYIGLIVHVSTSTALGCHPAVVMDFDLDGDCLLHWLGGATSYAVPYKVPKEGDFHLAKWHFVEG